MEEGRKEGSVARQVTYSLHAGGQKRPTSGHTEEGETAAQVRFLSFPSLPFLSFLSTTVTNDTQVERKRRERLQRSLAASFLVAQ